MNRRDLLKLAGMGVAVFVFGRRVAQAGPGRKRMILSILFSSPTRIGALTDPTSILIFKGR